MAMENLLVSHTQPQTSSSGRGYTTTTVIELCLYARSSMASYFTISKCLDNDICYIITNVSSHRSVNVSIEYSYNVAKTEVYHVLNEYFEMPL